MIGGRRLGSVTAAVASLLGICPRPGLLFEILSFTFIPARVEVPRGGSHAGVRNPSQPRSWRRGDKQVTDHDVIRRSITWIEECGDDRDDEANIRPPRQTP